jgi:hypothetical protein
MNPHYWDAFETADPRDIARRIMKDIVRVVAPAVRPSAIADSRIRLDHGFSQKEE